MDYMYLDVNGVPMKAEADTMKLLAVLSAAGDGSVIEREPTERECAMWNRNLFWSGSEIGRVTAERLARDSSYEY